MVEKCRKCFLIFIKYSINIIRKTTHAKRKRPTCLIFCLSKTRSTHCIHFIGLLTKHWFVGEVVKVPWIVEADIEGAGVIELSWLLRGTLHFDTLTKHFIIPLHFYHSCQRVPTHASLKQTNFITLYKNG